MSNYPPGVSGNEWQIAGPQAETIETREVEHECDPKRFEEGFVGEVEAEVTYWDRYSPLGIAYTCPKCGAEVETEEERDPDE